MKYGKRTMFVLLAAILCCFNGVVNGDIYYSCSYINTPSVDCSRFSDDLTCATNLVTYKNKCEFSKAHCRDSTIDIKHYGNCTSADGTTPAPINGAGSDHVLDFFCTHLSHTNCPVGGTKICASDGRIYDNACEYEKAMCTHRNIMIVDCHLKRH
ncbi:agrin-like [Ruditapes philippinarum]|uniref:agrin-like n=1 Tax=Ruditapes philippinarum TaxID=129788 RepID=UPI00295AEB80|nr:agrin-like [Ruditapes philippinarum]